MLTGDKYSVQSPPKTGDRARRGYTAGIRSVGGGGAWGVQIGLWRGRRDPNRPGSWGSKEAWELGIQSCIIVVVGEGEREREKLEP